MKRSTAYELAVMVALISITVGLRLYFRHIPNFAPVAASALFAGFFFRSRWIALAVPVMAMFITDQLLGSYHPFLMVTVYGLLALPVMMRAWIRDGYGRSRCSAWSSMATLLCCTLTASILFFVATNLVTWWVTPWYPRSFAGVWQCYVSAVPFFRYTLAGDLIFATTFFGSYAVITSIRSWRLLAASASVAGS